MFPTLTSILQYLFGINILLPVQTFGLLLAISFIAAYWAMSKELKRKAGLFADIPTQMEIGKPKTKMDYLIAVVTGFLLGYKLGLMFTDYDTFSNNPQDAILSLKGNILGGVILGGLMTYFTWNEDRQNRKTPHEIKTIILKPHQLMGSITGLAAIWGLIGAKLFDNLENPALLIEDPIGSLLSFSGLTFYGGLICGAAAVLWFARKKNINLLHLIDSSAPALILAYGVGRIGCQLSGDGDWGIVNTAPKPAWMGVLPDWVWSFKYPHNVNSEGLPIPGCVGPHCSELPFPVFPTPIYETIMALAIFGILWMLRKRISIPGMLFSIYMILNGAERLLIEQIRVNERYHLGSFSFTQAELIAVLMMAAGLAGIVITKIWASKKPILEPSEN
ncbi:MAG: prolipoprotein diacylglyceryl transferase [Bacteroidota bacterium]|nr:prolipoprotein diacylglyceryl transferase [Bacteroidota bacterium]